MASLVSEAVSPASVEVLEASVEALEVLEVLVALQASEELEVLEASQASEELEALEASVGRLVSVASTATDPPPIAFTGTTRPEVEVDQAYQGKCFGSGWRFTQGIKGVILCVPLVQTVRCYSRSSRQPRQRA